MIIILGLIIFLFVYHVKFLEELERDSLQSQQDYENGTADFLDKVREGE